MRVVWTVARWVVGLAVIAVVVGLGASSVETIPNNAKVLVSPGRRAWLPDAEFVHARLRATSSDPAVWSFIRDMEKTTFGEVRSGRFKGFELLEGWEQPHDNFRTGRPKSWIRAKFYPTTESRWNPDGSWSTTWEPLTSEDWD